jgi:Asp-tRNA(Asn)/Glu-tRNA(Gln) amidotransferase A subunit family amidase
MRHTQGDFWDLFLLYPMEGMGQYYAPERLARIAQARTPSGRTGAELEREIDARIAWREDLFVQGPPHAEVKAAWADAGFYHVEMYEGLAGKREELVRERHMENAYATALGRHATKVFTRIAGSSADGYTLGFYKDLKAYANQPETTREQQEAAAKAAGFRGADFIGPTLRTFILRHWDTMGVAIR